MLITVGSLPAKVVVNIYQHYIYDVPWSVYPYFIYAEQYITIYNNN